MKKYMIAINALFVTLSLSAQSIEEIKPPADSFVKGRRSGEQVNIGVVGASYLLLPANTQDNAPEKFLGSEKFFSSDCVNLHLSQDPGKNTLFYFEWGEYGTLSYSFKSRITPKDIDERNKACVVFMDTNSRFSLQFLEYRDASRPLHLQYDAKDQIMLGGLNHPNLSNLWTLRPIYEFLDLKLSIVDSETLLFKIPRKERVSDLRLSPDQIRDLYACHYRFDPNKALTILKETDDFVFASNPELFYTQGVYIQATSLILQISNLAGFSKGVDRHFTTAKSNCRVNEGNDLTLNPGEILFLKPNYSGRDAPLPLIGNVEIIPSFPGIADGPSLITHYNLPMMRIIKDDIANGQLRTLFPKFGVEFVRSNSCLTFFEQKGLPL